MSVETPWGYFEGFDELRYYGYGRKPLLVWVETDDVEILFDEDGEILDLAIRGASRYVERSHRGNSVNISLTKQDQ